MAVHAVPCTSQLYFFAEMLVVCPREAYVQTIVPIVCSYTLVSCEVFNDNRALKRLIVDS